MRAVKAGRDRACKLTGAASPEPAGDPLTQMARCANGKSDVPLAARPSRRVSLTLVVLRLSVHSTVNCPAPKGSEDAWISDTSRDSARLVAISLSS